MKTFLGFTTGILSGFIVGISFMGWVYHKPEQNDSKEEA